MLNQIHPTLSLRKIDGVQYWVFDKYFRHDPEEDVSLQVRVRHDAQETTFSLYLLSESENPREVIPDEALKVRIKIAKEHGDEYDLDKVWTFGQLRTIGTVWNAEDFLQDCIVRWKALNFLVNPCITF